MSFREKYLTPCFGFPLYCISRGGGGKAIILFIILLHTLYSSAQLRFCDIDTNQCLQLKIHVQSDTSNVYIKYTVSNEQSSCFPLDIKIDSETGKIFYQDRYIIEERIIDSTRHYLNVQKAINWLIVIDDAYGKVNDLSKLDLFERVTVSNCKKIEIQELNSQNLRLNVEKWSVYTQLKESDYLQEFKIGNAMSFNDFNHNLSSYSDLMNTFTNLHKLMYDVNLDLSLFKQIEKIDGEGFVLGYNNPYCLFDHRLVQNKQLKLQVYTFVNRTNTYHYDKYLYPEKYFFFNELNHDFPGHPIAVTDSLIAVKNLKQSTLKQPVCILYKDLYFDWENTDTLASGSIENGKKTGVWKYYFQGDFQDTLSIDFDRKNTVSFPENGLWSYNYPNGQKAIEGSFKHGKKEGEWKFYYPDGKLESIKNFKKDLPEKLFLQYRYNSPTVRIFFKNSYEYLYSVENSAEIKNNAIDSDFFYSCIRKQLFYENGHFAVVRNQKKVNLTKIQKRRLLKKAVKQLYPEIK